MKHLHKELLKSERQISDLDTINASLRRLTFDVIHTDLRKGHIDELTKEIYAMRMKVVDIMGKLHEEAQHIEEMINGLKYGNR